MRAIFGVLALLVVVVVVGVLARKQLGAGVAPATAAAPGVATPSGTPRQQQEQFRQALEGAMQQARPMPDDSK